MGKLRRSRFAKFIAGMMILILAASIIANIVGTVLLLEENLYYASRKQFQQKVYSYVYNITASDLMFYLQVMENAYCNNDDYINYHQSEIELYKSKYSPEKSNIQFYISDENGNLLLANNTKKDDDYFSFSSVYSTETDYYNWYKMGNSDSAELVTAAESTLFEATTSADPVTSNEEEDKEEVSTQKTETNADISENNKVSKSTVTNDYTDFATEIIYYYSGDINNNIFEYCKEYARSLNYDVTSLTFYQDEYSDYDGQIAENYSYVDDSRPERSFSTTLLSNGKTAEIFYKYNGTLSFSELTYRLSYASLILQNSMNDNMSLEHKQKKIIQLNVNINVPYSCTVNDIYKAAETLVDIAIVYRDNIIPITIIELILFLTAFVFIFYSAGYIPKKEKPIARGIHAIPTDIVFFLALTALLGCFALIASFDMLFFIFGAFLAVIIILGIIYTSLVKVRANCFVKNTVLYRIFRLIKNASATLNESTGSRIKIFLTISAFLFISAVEALSFILFNNETIALFIMLIRLAEVPIIAAILVALVALQKGAKQISSGDINYRINNSFLFGPLKKHADNLNSINYAVNNAIEERMKSENLKTELITNVSHDLKTPLTSIVNYVDLLKKEQIENPKALEYIDVIDRQSQRLKKLTIDIVEASKAATGNIDIHYENTALNVILLQTNGEYFERLEENNLTLVQDIPEKDITISTDGRLLWRVIDNLMNNICKYSMPGTRVYLSLYEENGSAKISFKNISKNKLNIAPTDLTERFVRGDTSRNTEGSGLGLSIAKSLTENMGGKLYIFIDGDLFKVTLSFPLKNT